VNPLASLNAVFIAPALGEASARLRILSSLDRLRGASIEAQALEIPRTSRPRWRFIRDLRHADVVVLHRKLFGRLELAFLRRNCRRLLFDFDDAVMFRDPFRKSTRSRRRAARFARTVAAADGVVAGNAYLRERALEAGASGDVRVLPTGVEAGKYAPGPPLEGEERVLGWIGSASTLPYLLDILPELEELARQDPRFRLRVIADAFPETDAISLDPRPWSEEDEAGLLQGIDVGLMPLRDDPWSRGKCGYKILQYFAAGKPAVASPVGVNRSLVLPGETGLLADGQGEWVRCITALASDPDRGAGMGRAGRRLVETGGFTLDAYADGLASILREFA
jgi:glycosyltransferase involved in cell wall biosynthesis